MQQPDEAWIMATNKLRLLRGTYLDQMIAFEGVLDAHLFDYIEPREEYRLLFYATVLAGLPLRRKAEIMADFVEHSGLSGFDDLAGNLRGAVDFRNRCAHSHLQSMQDESGMWTAANARFVRYRKGHLHEEFISEAELMAQLERVPKLLDRLWEFGCALLTAREESRRPARE